MDNNETNALNDFLNDKDGRGNTYAQVYRGLFSKNEEELTSAQHNDRMEFASEIFKRNFGMELIEALDFDDDEINDFVATVRIRIAEMQMENNDTLYVEMFEAESTGKNSVWDKEKLFNSLSDQDRDDLMDTAKNLYYKKTGRHFDGEINFDPFTDEFQGVIYDAIERQSQDPIGPKADGISSGNDSDAAIYEAIVSGNPERYSDADMDILLNISHSHFEAGLSIADAVSKAKEDLLAGPVSNKIDELRLRLNSQGFVDMNALSDNEDNNEQLFLEVFGSNPSLYTEEEAAEIMAIAQEEVDAGMVYSEAADEARNIWAQVKYLAIRNKFPSSIFEEQNLFLDKIDTPKKLVAINQPSSKVDLSDYPSEIKYCEKLIKIMQPTQPKPKKDTTKSKSR
jgi:hypothetical protein